MNDHLTYRTPRGSSAVMGILMGFFSAGAFYIALTSSEEDLLNAKVRRGGGLIKMVEQSIGWDAFALLLIAVGFLLALSSAAFLWRVIDGRPDVRLTDDGLEFHPAIRSEPASYDDVESWSVDYVQGNPIVRLTFTRPYWSLSGLYPRRSLKIEGRSGLLEPFLEDLSDHRVMAAKRVD